MMEHCQPREAHGSLGVQVPGRPRKGLPGTLVPRLAGAGSAGVPHLPWRQEAGPALFWVRSGDVAGPLGFRQSLCSPSLLPQAL